MEMNKTIEKLWWETRLLFYKLFGRKYQANCGHKCKLMAKVKVFEEEIIFRLDKKDLDYCQQCLSDMSIRCAWCGGSITVGDAITLYTPTKKDFQIPDYAVFYKRVPFQLVGCLRWGCADSGIDRAGFWVPPGKVYRILSPMEMLIASGSEKPIICNNLGNIKT